MIVNRREMLIGTGGALLSGALPAWASEIQIIGGPAFGNWWRAVLPPSADATLIKAVIENAIASVDEAMSPFKPSSEISQFNTGFSTDWRPVSDATGAVIAESLRIAQLTSGAFDPTVGPLVARYGFGPIKGTFPAGYQSIQIDKEKLRKTVPEASLDLCGIAKGYALDTMADQLTFHGINSFLLEAGGEIVARGTHHDGRLWQAAIETPGTPSPAIQRIVKLDGKALATSGDAANGGQEGGVNFNHIVDPLTQLPVNNGIASVSVISNTAMEADALATALMVLGRERGLALAAQQGIAALFLTRSTSGILESMSEQFTRHIII